MIWSIIYVHIQYIYIYLYIHDVLYVSIRFFVQTQGRNVWRKKGRREGMHECKTGRNHEHSRHTLNLRRIHEWYIYIYRAYFPKAPQNIHIRICQSPTPYRKITCWVMLPFGTLLRIMTPPKKKKEKHVVRFTACRYRHRRTLFYFWMRFRCDLDQTSSLPRVIVRFGSSFLLMSQPDGSKGVDELLVDDVLWLCFTTMGCQNMSKQH